MGLFTDSLEREYEHKIEVNPRLLRKHVSNQANKKAPFYNWFNFKEGFSKYLVEMFIRDYPKKNCRILDPFSGSGTTLFTAQEMNLEAVGIEIMPIGGFILKSRESALRVNVSLLIDTIKKLKEMTFLEKDINENTKFRHLTITKGAFPKKTEKKLNVFLEIIEKEISNKNIKQLLRFACFCILEDISYTRKDGQYLRWDSRSARSKSKFKKKKIYSFEGAIFNQLDKMINDISNQKLFLNNLKEKPKIKLISGSNLEEMPKLESESFDLIITSPPYCNRYDYTRTYALELAFLGLDDIRIKELRQKLLSCTVENKDKNDFLKRIYNKEYFRLIEDSFFSDSCINEIISHFKRLREMKKLNNPNIYRMIKNYIYEHSFVIFEMFRLLKKGGRIYYVNDNVRYSGKTVPIDLILSEIAKKAGFKIKGIFKLQKGKGNSSQQMSSYGRTEVRKCVYYWEK